MPDDRERVFHPGGVKEVPQEPRCVLSVRPLMAWCYTSASAFRAAVPSKLGPIPLWPSRFSTWGHLTAISTAQLMADIGGPPKPASRCRAVRVELAFAQTLRFSDFSIHAAFSSESMIACSRSAVDGSASSTSSCTERIVSTAA
ncbi:MAG: hypothetical protein QOK18_1379 [Mycobacterium sp.]|jgi:hypothetical protein|nr:hypothetical protein [Mycobacterium sp.]